MSKSEQYQADIEKALTQFIQEASSYRATANVESVPSANIATFVQTHIAPVNGPTNRLNVTIPEGKFDWRRNALELAFRRKLLDVIVRLPESDKERYHQVFDCLDTILAISEADYVDTVVPLTLIEELLDIHTISGCEHLFSYVEKRKNQLTVNMVPGRGKGLILLRMCNEMLRRLSKEKNTVFCGRILMFLANSFPLGERSGVNLRGDFNTEVVRFDSDEEVDADTTMTDDQKEFYKLFWSIRKYFSNPPTIFQGDNFKELQKGADAILHKFQDIAKREEAISGAGNSKEAFSVSQKRERIPDIDDESMDTAEQMLKEINRDYQFPRLLSSRKLLELEIEDARFRRNVMVQFLILFQYLSGFTKEEKEATQSLLSARGATAKQSLVQPTFTLEDDQMAWVEEMKTTMISLLKAIKPHGKMYTEIVLTILRHERNWIIWKASGCPVFEKPPISAQVLQDLWKSKRPRLVRSAPPFRFIYGNAEMTNMYGRPRETLSTLMQSRPPAPAAVQVIDRAIAALDDSLDPPRERFNLANGALFQSTRLLFRTHAYLIPKVYVAKKEIYKALRESEKTSENEDKPEEATVKVVSQEITEDQVQAEIKVLQSTRQIILDEQGKA
ncbi:THO complex subunit 1 transcription elongation factor-domain-containing protein [Radiomyces spectabilis]|uniref:THO complex subunit 1 transcription elongation factor-domain-containing protein n=1 Tax=Radiomyces spectabilis TaxID=64574 RepID=UPI002220F014|nr:THO complex subunit 1 transcription elongation factor-domain-containing protein [Radiomyces spectabilis]KAI8371467.1 THO complex subunit 1 transcription elongation factor-domain-containing protein [Radiomyces spectabilis]